MMKLSFIIPVYQTAHLLARCLDSVLAQQLDNIEIIVINDGSSDDVDSIIQQYQLPYLCYIKQDNQGISAVRNRGLQLAKGKYIMFIDSDDYLVATHLKQLLAQAEKNNLQLLRGNFTNIYLNGSHHHNPYFITTFDAVVTGQSYYVSEVLANKENMKNMPWMWLFERRFLIDHHIQFDTHTTLLEDVLFIATCCQYAERVSAVNLPIYYYVQYPQSATNSMKLNEASQQMLYVSECLLKQAKQVEGDFKKALQLYAGYVSVFALKIYRHQGYQQTKIINQLKAQSYLFEADSQARQTLFKLSPYLFSQYLWGVEYQQRLTKKIRQWVTRDDA